MRDCVRLPMGSGPFGKPGIVKRQMEERVHADNDQSC